MYSSLSGGSVGGREKLDNPTLAIVGRELVASTKSVEKMKIKLKKCRFS